MGVGGLVGVASAERLYYTINGQEGPRAGYLSPAARVAAGCHYPPRAESRGQPREAAPTRI